MEIAAGLDECRLVRLHVRGDALVNGRARLASDGHAGHEREVNIAVADDSSQKSSRSTSWRHMPLRACVASKVRIILR